MVPFIIAAIIIAGLLAFLIYKTFGEQIKCFFEKMKNNRSTPAVSDFSTGWVPTDITPAEKEKPSRGKKFSLTTKEKSAAPETDSSDAGKAVKKPNLFSIGHSEEKTVEERGEVYLSRRRSNADVEEPAIIRLTCTGNLDRPEGYTFDIRRSDLPLFFSDSDNSRRSNTLVFSNSPRNYVENNHCSIDIEDGHVVITDHCSRQGINIDTDSRRIHLSNRDEPQSDVLTSRIFRITTGYITSEIEILPDCAEYITDRFVRVQISSSDPITGPQSTVVDVRNNDSLGRTESATVKVFSNNVERFSSYFRIGQPGEPNSIVSVGGTNIFTLPDGTAASRVDLTAGVEFSLDTYKIKVIESFSGYGFPDVSPAENTVDFTSGASSGILSSVKLGRNNQPPVRLARRIAKGKADDDVVMNIRFAGPVDAAEDSFDITFSDLPVYISCNETARDASTLIIAPSMQVQPGHCLIGIDNGMLTVTDCGATDNAAGTKLIVDGQKHRLSNSRAHISSRSFTLTAGWATLYVTLKPAIISHISDSFAVIKAECLAPGCEDNFDVTVRDRFNLGRASDEFVLSNINSPRRVGYFDITRGKAFRLNSQIPVITGDPRNVVCDGTSSGVIRIVSGLDNPAFTEDGRTVPIDKGVVFELVPILTSNPNRDPLYRFTVLDVCDGIDFGSN